MRRVSILFSWLVACAGAGAEPAEVSFLAADEIRIYGDLYSSAGGKAAPIVLLFHQGAGDARGEYSAIAPRLRESGYNVLAIDQRTGGDIFGGVNRTMAGAGDTEYSYCDAYPDLEGALAFVRDDGFSGPLAAWGSSYSAALVFQLAARLPEQVDAVLGFSPASGPPLADCALDQYLDRLDVPALALRPQREFEIESVQRQMAAFQRQGIQVYVANPGVHGSSMLNEDRVGESTEATWQVVLDFLAETLRAD